MPRKSNFNLEENEMSEQVVESKVKQIFRLISTNVSAGGYPVEEVDEYINGFLKQGYRLITAQALSHGPEGIYVYYALVQDK